MDARSNLRAILLMVGSMAAFAIEDMFVKFVAVDMPTGQILMFLGLGGIPVFGWLAHRKGARVWTRDALHPTVIWRNAGEVIGTWGFITALALVPLATVSAILQAMPLAVTFGAALFLGEAVGWRRWTAILVGFFGVLMVIRPGLSGFDANALWALLAVAGLSLRDLATRRVPRTVSSTQLSVWGFAAVALLGAAMLAVSGGAVWPEPVQILWLACALTGGIVGYWAITEAMRLGEVATVTPFRYSRLVFALIIGVLVFGERPDAATLLGAALIIASGLYTFARERRLKRALSMNAATQ